MTKVRQISHILETEDDDNEAVEDALIVDSPTLPSSTNVSAPRIQIRQSPYIEAFHHNHVVRLTLDIWKLGLPSHCSQPIKQTDPQPWKMLERPAWHLQVTTRNIYSKAWGERLSCQVSRVAILPESSAAALDPTTSFAQISTVLHKG